MTQEGLSSAAGLEPSYISELDNDQKSPTVKTLVRLCGALGIRASSLLARLERTEARVG